MSRIYSEEEKKAYVEDFKNSGMSKVQYSKKMYLLMKQYV